ncbi:MAG: PEP-CTERM sorting domain-containing protein [Phycisphaeraceae bacterium]
MNTKHHSYVGTMTASLAGGVVLAMTASAPAAVLVYDGFEASGDGSGSAYQADTSVVGQSDARTGFAGAWADTGATLAPSVNFNPRTTGLTYAGYSPNDAGSLEAYRSTGNHIGSAKQVSRSLDYASPGTDDYYVSFLLEYDGTADDDTTITLAEPGTNTTDRDATFSLDHATDQLTFTPAGSTADTYSETLNSGSNLIVLRAIYDAGDASGNNPSADFYDQYEIWINPTISGDDLGAADAAGFGILRSFTGGATPLPFTDLRFTHSLNTAHVTLDEFMISQSTDSFLVPEPASLTLLGAGGLLMLLRRRPA